MIGLTQKIEAQLKELRPSVVFELPSGRRLGPPDAPLTLSFTEWSTLARLAAGQLGAAAEQFVEDQLRLGGDMRHLMNAAAQWVRVDPTRKSSLLTRLSHFADLDLSHSPSRNAKNIQFHYDVSDQFFKLWLDPLRVYSCAYYRNPTMRLADAQKSKLDLICRKLMLQPNERFLDLGAGWGGLLLWATEHYGVDATGITLSKNQHTYVENLIRERGLQNRARIVLCDYRHLSDAQPFDKIASVGMFEHVGRNNMLGYFKQIHALLRPGGMVLNHGITAGGVHNLRVGAGLGQFIQKYIFPGGELLHASKVLEEMALAGLETVDCENLRPHYARTLWHWSDALESRLDEALVTLKADRNSSQAAKILRAYRLYLAGSAMCFEQGWLALHQMLATRPDSSISSNGMPGGQSQYPFDRSYIYNPNC